MKLKDFLIEFPDQESIDNSQEIQDLEVKILLQPANDIIIQKDMEVNVKEIETDWTTNTILIKTDYI